MDLENGSRDQPGQVLLSFSRGKDEKEPAASCVVQCLSWCGVIISDLHLQDYIANDQFESIVKASKIAIIIFSKRYASSRSCLEELTKIMDFSMAYDLAVLPIFYGVNSFQVCNQESSFGQAFQGLIRRISPIEGKVSRWRTALSEVRGWYGFGMKNIKARHDSKFFQKLSKYVDDILFPKVSSDGLVGVISQGQQVIHKLTPKDVVSIGIWGMGGSGKTTLAKVIFDLIQNEYESTCFVSNVKEAWERKGKAYLQEQLLSVICEATDMGICIESTILKLKERPCSKKVLVVLDDVNHLEQLHALCGSREWFGKGSKIIITTRDLFLLNVFQVDLVYPMKLLSDRASLQLFRQGWPKEEFIELRRKVVACSEGLPLALKVLDSLLSERSLMEWELVLMNLSTNLPSGIYYNLKRSFDSLDDNGKEIFLNMVLFYNGEDMNDVIQKLEGHGCDASTGIRVLEDRSLVTIDKNYKIRVHNMLQLMGRKIIYESSQNDVQSREHSGHKYEVFLSFRGEDTRATFTSHLYSALSNAGITVFKDDLELPRGNHIKTELLQAIGSSKIAIIIFSREYAGSKWCLEEMSMIMELHKSNHQVVLPVFYNVNPSEIRSQTSCVGKSFKDLIQRISPPKDQISKWSKALTEAGGTAGFVVPGCRDESEHVKAIVENVCDILDKKYLIVAEHPVGVDNRVQEVISMLENHLSQGVAMVGIWGMGGIGKTTIAKAIYNEISHTFESRIYLSKIREVWGQEKDQVSLQNQLLSEICKTTKMKINNVELGKITLRDRLRHKKALVVLDDVDESAQLNALVGSRDWFKPGSVIIITTRNQRLLFDCGIYRVNILDEGESLELFSWHAFKQETPQEDFTNLSRDLVAYSGKLPLALEVLGSYLSGRNVDEWKSVLEKLKRIPNDKIQKKLKLSFDGLDYLEKEIFLDISCFFIGMDRNDVTHILNGCEFFADIGIKTLVERSLVTIGEKNELGMHDLLRDMGREIIREQSQKELGKRSRLWFPKDAFDVLLKHMGTKAIEGLSLKLLESEEIHIESFKMMKRLRLLHLEDVQLKGDYKYISEDLRWLCWHGFPIKYIPSNFYQKKLVAIDLKYSRLKQVWREPQVLEMLKILNLSHSPYLVLTPDFSNLPNLEQLILKDCPSLSVIHDSIGLLDQLFLLNLEDCIGLTSLPRSVYRLRCLKTLILYGCKNIEKLEEDIEQMESLTTLVAPTIKQVPFSFVRLKRICYLFVCGYEGSPRHVIPSLLWSWMSPTNSPLSVIPTHAGMPSSILSDMLDSICDHPLTIHSSEPKQQSLLLEDGMETSDSLCRATNCMDILRFENCSEHLLIQIGKNSHVFRTLSERVSQGLSPTKCSDDCVFPGNNYPYWLTFKGEGDSVKFKVPPVNGGDHLKGITICSVYIRSGDLVNKACQSCIICLMITNYTKITTLVYTKDKLNSLEEAERKEIISNLESDDQVEVKAVFGSGFTVKKTIVYLIYNESFDEQMEPSTSGTKHKCEEEEEEEEEEAHQSIRPRKAMKI